MGLAAPKKRRKISHDPQNTTWSRNATSFGHRQLLSQGWTPGTTLGAASAPHAKFFTKASSSHVRLVLREENLGLGAKAGSGFDNGECTGLGGLQDLLGRLNGKSSEVIEQARKNRDDLKRKVWAERRYGGLGFVSGGLLVGDDVVVKAKKKTGKRGVNPDLEELNNISVEMAGGESFSGSEMMPSASVERTTSKTKRKRRSKVDIEATETPLSGVGPIEEKEVLLDPVANATVLETSDSVVLLKRQRKEAKAQKKAEKAQRKLDRRRRKGVKLRDDEPTEQPLAPLPERSMTEVPATTSTSTPHGQAPNVEPSAIASSNRLAVRQRQIQQKKRSMLDPRALNEILMVKAQ